MPENTNTDRADQWRHQLDRALALPDRTLVLADMSNDDALISVRGRDPLHLVHLARDLLSQAEDALHERNPEWQQGLNDMGDAPDERLLSTVLEALELLPDPHAGDEH
jgi:hypothetical protein